MSGQVSGQLVSCGQPQTLLLFLAPSMFTWCGGVGGGEAHSESVPPKGPQKKKAVGTGARLGGPHQGCLVHSPEQPRALCRARKSHVPGLAPGILTAQAHRGAGPLSRTRICPM